MTVDIAFANLADSPPHWLLSQINESDTTVISRTGRPRRLRELQWSRGLKSRLLQKNSDASCQHRCFSISHDRHLTAVAVSDCAEVGIDLQSHRSAESCKRIASAWFPESEAAEIVDSENVDRFLVSWVLKEAWAKLVKRSIFETCQMVSFQNGQIFIQNTFSSPISFAWSRIETLCGSKLEQPAVCGVCVNGRMRRQDIRSLMAGANQCLTTFNLEWNLCICSGNSGH